MLIAAAILLSSETFPPTDRPGYFFVFAEIDPELCRGSLNCSPNAD